MNVLVKLLAEGYALSPAYPPCSRCSGEPSVKMKDHVKNLGCKGLKLWLWECGIYYVCIFSLLLFSFHLIPPRSFNQVQSKDPHVKECSVPC